MLAQEGHSQLAATVKENARDYGTNAQGPRLGWRNSPWPPGTVPMTKSFSFSPTGFGWGHAVYCIREDHYC